jgi:hypothetical protein
LKRGFDPENMGSDRPASPVDGTPPGPLLAKNHTPPAMSKTTTTIAAATPGLISFMTKLSFRGPAGDRLSWSWIFGKSPEASF